MAQGQQSLDSVHAGRFEQPHRHPGEHRLGQGGDELGALRRQRGEAPEPSPAERERGQTIGTA